MRQDFNHVDHGITLPKLEQITNENGTRVYVTPEGNAYPSVTTVLSAGDKSDGLKSWQQRVGEKEAAGILKQAGDRGSIIHDGLEQYLKNNKDYLKTIDSINRGTILEMLPIIDHIDDIYFLESRLYSNKLKVAGTVDCIAYFKGTIAIIDFKTSRSVKKKEWITNYFMQGAAYAACFYEMTGIVIKDIVIIMYTNHNEPQVFEVKVKDYINEFIKVRKEYDEISNL